MKKIFLSIIFSAILSTGLTQSVVEVSQSDDGYRLLIDNTPTIVNGMNWDYFPIGTNYTYSLWNQSDELIIKALDGDMQLLQNMGANAVRMYNGVPARWIEYIYDNYGIYTMVNNTTAIAF